MSGPKVFRIVPLDEARRYWQTWLVQLQSRLEYWVSTCQRIGDLLESEEKDQRIRLARIQGLVEIDNFSELIAEGLSFEKFLEADLATRLDKAAIRNVARQKAISSAGTTASVLLKMARESAVQLPEQTVVLLKQAAERGIENLSVVEDAILVAVNLIQPVALTAPSERLPRQIELVDDWLQRTGYLSQPSVRDVQVESVERMLCELIGFGHLDEAESFRRRLAAVSAQSVEARRLLALDVLCQELQQAVEKARRWGKLRQRSAELRAEAEQTGDVAVLQNAMGAFEQAFEQGDEAAASTALDVQRETLDASIALKNVELRRAELLRGLMQLGYTVNPGLLKIWSAQKQVVIRKAVQSATGLELLGDLTTGKCQVRVVSLDAGTAGHASIDSLRAEEHWCADVLELQRDLEKRGVSLVVERATPAGTIPLKPAKCTWVSDFAAAEAADDSLQSGRREMQERHG